RRPCGGSPLGSTTSMGARTRALEPSDDDPLVHHLQRHLGEISTSGKAAARNAASERVPRTLAAEPDFGRLDRELTLELVEANIDRTAHTLVTRGMSRRPMNVPPEVQHGVPENFRYAELGLALPFAWPLDDASLAEPQHSWPLALLARLR